MHVTSSFTGSIILKYAIPNTIESEKLYQHFAGSNV